MAKGTDKALDTRPKVEKKHSFGCLLKLITVQNALKNIVLDG